MYAESRQDPTSDPELLEDSLQLIAKYFGVNWLSTTGGNSLQLVWNRRDWLASAEMVNFSAGLRIADRNSTWMIDAVNKIKTGDHRNRQGAVFEVFMAGALHNPSNHIVQLPPPNTPGYDLIVNFPDDAKLYVSLKNYRMSSHYQTMRLKSKEIEELLVSTSRRHMQVLVNMEAQYPAPRDWNELREFVKKINDIDFGRHSIGEWEISVFPLFLEQGLPYDQKLSYTLIINTRYHKNEEANLLSRLDEACANIDRYGRGESETSANIILVRIPTEVSLAHCAEWVQNYLTDHPTAKISGVALYQPSVTTDPNGGQSVITHGFNFTLRPESVKWFSSGHTVSMVVPLGVRSSETSKLVLRVGEQTIDVEDRYLYQSGHHYQVCKADEQGSLSGNATVLQGIHTHPVLWMHGRYLELSGIFPPQHELTLL